MFSSGTPTATAASLWHWRSHRRWSAKGTAMLHTNISTADMEWQEAHKHEIKTRTHDLESISSCEEA
eukprot:4191663-Amphidinium_carterae.1